MAATSHDGTSEASTGAIVEAAQFFFVLRGFLHLSIESAADLLGTEPQVIWALETGKIDALPSWPEVERLVEAYTGLANCDPGPVLAVLRAEIDRRESMLRDAGPALHDEAASPTGGPIHQRSAGLADATEVRSTGPRWRKGRGGRPVPVGPRFDSQEVTPRPGSQYALSLSGIARPFLRASAAVLGSRAARIGLIGSVLALGVFMALCQPRLVHFATSRLPDPLAAKLRSVHDYLLVMIAPERKGLRWIEVSDPRIRRTDKLHNARQTD